MEKFYTIIFVCSLMNFVYADTRRLVVIFSVPSRAFSTVLGEESHELGTSLPTRKILSVIYTKGEVW